MINEIIRYVALGIGIALIIVLTIIAIKIHAFSKLFEEARDKDTNEDDKKE